MGLIIKNGSTQCFQPPIHGWYNQFCTLYLYPCILLLGTGGNLANLLVYSHPFFRSSPTVRLLNLKAIVNLGHVFSMSLNYVYYVNFPGENVHVPTADNSTIFNTYWSTLQYTLYANNLCSSLAVWMTVAAIVEHYVLVVCPLSGQNWSSMRNSNLFIAVSIPAAGALHAFILVYYRVYRIPCWFDVRREKILLSLLADPRQKFAVLPVFINLIRQPTGEINVNYNADLAWWIRAYKSGYFWLSSLLCNVCPLIILAFCSVSIYHRLFHRNRTLASHHTAQKRCVVKLALTSTASHLLLEIPQVPVFILTALKGTTTGAWPHQEAVSAAAASTSLLNSSIPFLLYFCCSSRFRHLAMERFTFKTVDVIEATRDIRSRVGSISAVIKENLTGRKVIVHQEVPSRRRQNHHNQTAAADDFATNRLTVSDNVIGGRNCGGGGGRWGRWTKCESDGGKVQQLRTTADNSIHSNANTNISLNNTSGDISEEDHKLWSEILQEMSLVVASPTTTTTTMPNGAAHKQFEEEENDGNKTNTFDEPTEVGLPLILVLSSPPSLTNSSSSKTSAV